MFKLVLKIGDRVLNTFLCQRETTVVGRGKECDVVVENVGVSRKHFQIRREKDKFIVTDLGSTNGTLLNGKPVAGAELKTGDVLNVGKVDLHFALETEEEALPFFDIEKTMELRLPQSGDAPAAPAEAPKNDLKKFVGSVMSASYHRPDCKWQKGILPQRKIFFASAEEAVRAGKKPCGTCKPA